MKNQPISLVCALMLTLAFSIVSCNVGSLRGHGDVLSEERNASNYHGIRIAVPGETIVKEGPVYSLRVQAEENLLPYLETEVENGILNVYFSRNVWDADDVLIEITAPNLDAFDLSGSANVKMLDALEGNNLNVNVSGSGDIDLLYVDFVNIISNVSGSGAISMRGKAEHLDAKVSGSGNIFAVDCPVKTAKIHVSGSGTVRCHVTDHLEAHVSGSGDILYRGNPSMEMHISGSGEIRKF